MLLALWALPWKGLALWKAAHSQNKRWFIVLLLMNSFGILDILYIFIFSKRKKNPVILYEEQDNVFKS